ALPLLRFRAAKVDPNFLHHRLYFGVDALAGFRSGRYGPCPVRVCQMVEECSGHLIPPSLVYTRKDDVKHELLQRWVCECWTMPDMPFGRGPMDCSAVEYS